MQLAPAHADSGVKPTARYNVHGVFDQSTQYPPMQTLSSTAAISHVLPQPFSTFYQSRLSTAAIFHVLPQPF